MSAVEVVADLVARQALQSVAAAATSAAAASACSRDNDYDGRMGLRISAIFVILIGSTFGKRKNSYTPLLRRLIADRRCFPRLRWSSSRSRSARMGLFHSQIFRLWCYHSDGFHSCVSVPSPIHRVIANSASSSPLLATPFRIPASQVR